MYSIFTFLCLGQDSSEILVSGLQIWPDHPPKYRPVCDITIKSQIFDLEIKSFYFGKKDDKYLKKRLKRKKVFTFRQYNEIIK